MSINFDDTLRAVYYLAGYEQDWLAGINEMPDGSVNAHWRFRYYDPQDPRNDAHSGQDKKNWYKADGKPGSPTLAAALAAMQGVMDEMQAHGYVHPGGVACKLVRGSMTTAKFFEEFGKLPFVHKRDATPEEEIELRQEFGDER